MIIPGKEWEEFVFLLQEERTRTEQNRTEQRDKEGKGKRRAWEMCKDRDCTVSGSVELSF